MPLSLSLIYINSAEPAAVERGRLFASFYPSLVGGECETNYEEDSVTSMDEVIYHNKKHLDGRIIFLLRRFFQELLFLG